MPSNFTPPLPDEVAALLARRDLAAAIEAMAAHGFTFLQAVATTSRRGKVPLGEAKKLVHYSPAYAPTKVDREAFWADLESAADDKL